MRKLLLASALFCFSAAVHAQDTLTYAMTQDIAYAQNIKNGTAYKVYVSKDGSMLKVGDTLKINQPQGGEATTAAQFSLKTKQQYQYIYIGHYTLGKALLVTPSPLTSDYRNETCVITEFRVQHTRLKRESPLTAMIYLVNPSAPRGLGVQNRTVHNYEMALEIGEVSNPRRAMTRAEAIAKLKESKELLDLEMIKQAEYDALKAKLAPIISQQ